MAGIEGLRGTDGLWRKLFREAAFPVGMNVFVCIVVFFLGSHVVLDRSAASTVSRAFETVEERPQPLEVLLQQDDTEPASEPTPTNTPQPTNTSKPTDTPIPPTETPLPPTHTATPAPTQAPSATATATVAPTATSGPPPPPTMTYTPMPPEPVDTPTVTATSSATVTPTTTPKPTKTATPTQTATVPPLPTVIRFFADRYQVQSGEAVILTWEVSGATGVQIFPGYESGVSHSGSVTVFPQGLTTYRLHVCNLTRCVDQDVMVQVTMLPTAPPGPTATPTDTPSPTPRPAQVRLILDKLADTWPSLCPP